MDFNKLIARVKNILVTPKTEWPVIAAEPETIQSLYINYIMILSAIPAVITFLIYSVIGISLPFIGTFRFGVGMGLVQMVVTYVLTLGVTYISMLIVDALAPSFNGVKDQVQALKSVAYSGTAGAVASVLGLIPGLGTLGMIAGGIYGIYLLYVGLPSTMKCPPEKAGGYAAVVIIIRILLTIVLGGILGVVTGASGAMSGAMGGGAFHASSTYTPDKDSALGALAAIGARAEEASKKMDAAQKSGDQQAQAQAAGQMLGAVLGGGDHVEALAPDALKPFVPEQIGGLPRTSFSAQKNGMMGMQMSTAEAHYGASGNPASYDLTVSDTGGAKGLMVAAGLVNVEEEKQTDHGFEKTYKQSGHFVTERWDNSGNGEYTIVLGNRFIVAVKGNGVANLDAIKAAASGVNLSGLEAMKAAGVKNG